MAILKKEKTYKWEFENIGGSSRVKITKGEDIAHLHELDPKMWTVLSCPVTGLEIDEKSLKFMDCDGDGKLRINDVVACSKWITSVLKDNDLLLKGTDEIDLDQINTENETGKKLYNSAKQILKNLGKEENRISISDTADITAIFAKTRFNGDGIITDTSSDNELDKAAITAAVAHVGSVMDRSGAPGVGSEQIEAFYKNLTDYVAWKESAVEAPFGDNTDKVIEAYNTLDAKVKDFFMRSELAAFSPESTGSLGIQTSRIEAISAENLSGKTEEIATYPLAHITGKAEIDLTAPINPAWVSAFKLIQEGALESGKTTLTPADWSAIGEKFAAYVAWKNAKAGACVEPLGMETIKEFIAQDRKAELLKLAAEDLALKEEAENIENVDKFLHILRDFYKLLKNFVTLHDFYNKNRKTTAIFQSGTLIIDQRACRFCMKVVDMAKHNAAVASCGMYLLYCDCTTKSQPGKLTIVAAVTVGEIGAFSVGKNGIYYDNAGREWDAVITKIVENPISISQAFWSPYRRMATTIENLINKSAADKDAKMMAKATENINALPTTTATATTATPEAKAAATPPFDIAKFAGIFAAIGMAVGMIATALSSIFTELFSLSWWKIILVFISIMLFISGPAMVMAWMKLRRRNIAPLLNANGWAINAASKISIPFGETLTEMAKYPKIKLKDPYAKKGIPTWKKWMYSIIVLIVALTTLWLTNCLSWANLPSPLFDKAENIEEVEAQAVTEGPVSQTESTDSVAVEAAQ